MSIVYLTSQARLSAKALNFLPSLLHLIVDCESRSFADSLNLFEIRYPYRYKRMGNNRIIAKSINVAGYGVLCILDVLKKGSKDADDFSSDQRGFGERKLENQFDIGEIEAFVHQKLAEESKTDNHFVKEALPENYQRWWDPFEHLHADDIVMESEDWIRTFEINRYSDFWQSYYKLVILAVDGGQPLFVGIDSNIKKLVDPDGRRLYYSNFLSGAAEFDYVTLTYLIDAKEVNDQNDAEFEENLCKKYSWLSKKTDLLRSTDEIAQYAKRGYPAYTLEDSSIWREIQKSETSNLALSGEETRLLSLLRHLPVGRSILPVFINGRAGSGKTTILHYLFSDYLYRKITLDLPGNLIFLSYSEPLVNIAKRNVRRLLDARPDFLYDSTTNDETASKIRNANLDAYFRPFLVFLREISQNTLVAAYPTDRYIDYRRFNQLMIGKNLPENLENHKLRLPHKGLTPDICWHVIRTYIKGYRASSYLTPEDYDEIPLKERSVSSEIFRQIFDTIWDKWYLPLTQEHEFWDTQDLVLQILREKMLEPSYAVIISDEAQDFTRIEIDLIMSLLLYQNFDLGWDKRIRLPFALAGDPFQTLNPTGFRWEAIKASFYDEIAANLDPENRGLIEIQYEELFYNYRSEAPIVRFSNLMQLWRKALFDTPNIEPQHPWREEQHIIPPRIFILDKTISLEQLHDLTRNAIIIVPCEQNQEQEFLDNDEQLRELKKAGIPFSLQSSILAKGQEFPQVILYKFGEHCPSHFFEKATYEQRLPNEYFLNKLYVAATRAMKSLIIVDTETGFQKLWDQAMDQQKIDHWCTLSATPEEWVHLIGGVTPGDYYGTAIEKQNPDELAEMLHRAGRENSSSDLLRQAMDFYRRANRDSLAKMCEAEALEMDEAYKQAGEIFLALGKKMEAERCFWQGKSWDDLAQLHLKYRSDKPIYMLVTNIHLAPKESKHAKEMFRFLLKQVKDGIQPRLSESQVQEAISLSAKRLLSDENLKSMKGDIWIEVTELFDSLPVLTSIIGNSDVAKIYNRAQNYSKATLFWESAGETKHIDYYLARAELASDASERIIWLDQAGKPERVIQEYSISPRTISQREKRLVAKAMEMKLFFVEAIELYIDLKEWTTAVRLIKDAEVNSNNKDQYLELADSIYYQLLNVKEVKLALDTFKFLSRNIPREKALVYGSEYVAALVFDGQWRKAFPFIIPKGVELPDFQASSLPNLSKIRSNEQMMLQGAFIHAFATNPADLIVKEKQGIVEVLLSIDRSGYSYWKEAIQLRDMATVMERTGKFIEMLPFYERVLQDQTLSASDQRFIQKRWLKVKFRQIEHTESEEGRRREASRERELKDNMRKWFITKEEIDAEPDFPSPFDLKSASESQEGFAKDLDIKWSSPKCRIKHHKHDAELIINISDGSYMEFNLELDKFEKFDKGQRFRIKSWTVEVEIHIGKELILKASGKEKRFVITE